MNDSDGRILVDIRETIAVAIATLDRPDGVKRCLEALWQGDLLPDEVIVVDQSDGELTECVVRSWSEARMPIQYVHQDRRGLSASRNEGLSRARADIVAMTDDDCVPHESWLAAISAAFRADSKLAAVTGRILPLGPEGSDSFAVSSRLSMERAVFAGKTPPWRAASGGNFAVRSDACRAIGGFDERLGAGTRGQASEDIDLAYRLLRSCHRIRYEPDALILHERQSLSRRMATRWTYGYGFGAFCGKWMAAHDPYAARLLSIWVGWRGRELARAVVRGRHQDARERGLMLAGTLAGLTYGLRLRGAR